MIINNNSVEQINIALLDLEKKLLTIKDDKSIIGSLKDSVNTIKASLNETKAGLTSGATYDINITGNATTATYAKTATTAEVANVAESAGISKTEDPVNGDELQIGSGSSQHITNAKHAAAADKAVEVVDYDNNSRTVKIGYSGSSVTADKLLYLAGYTEKDSNSVKLKDVDRAEVLKWLGIPTIRYADYKTESLTFSSLTDQKKIELSNFGPGVTEDSVLSFMVIYWSGIHIIAQADWAKSQGTGSSGLSCALHSLNNGTGWCVIRCVYLA